MSPSANPHAADKPHIPDHVFRTYDIRGPVKDTLTPALYHAIGRTCGYRLAPDSSVCVGWDTRESSFALAQALMNGLQEAGCTVHALGMVTTPLVYWAEHHLSCHAGLMVTGSHTPPDCNGLKLSLSKKPFFGEDLQALKTELQQSLAYPPRPTGKIVHAPCIHAYVHDVLKGFAWEASAPLHIVWDFGSGPAALLAPLIQKHLPFTHTCVHDHPMPQPLRSFDPTAPGALDQLIAKVTSTKAHAGIAFDGDGDRMVLVDGRGHVWEGDELLLFFATFQEDARHPVVVDIKSSPLLMGPLQKKRELCIAKTGHVHVKSLMAEKEASLGGEMSGHFFFRDRFLGFDDGFYAALRFLEIMAQKHIDPAVWHQNLPQRFSSPEYRIPMSDHAQKNIMATLENHIIHEKDIDRRDGLKVCTPDYWWIVRPSQTEPVLVLRWEGCTHGDYTKHLVFFKDLIQKECKGHFFL